MPAHQCDRMFGVAHNRLISPAALNVQMLTESEPLGTKFLTFMVNAVDKIRPRKGTVHKHIFDGLTVTIPSQHE